MSATPQPSNQTFNNAYNNGDFEAAQSTAENRWNGATGAVRTPDDHGVDATNEQQALYMGGQDAIREGKLKAKESMAAAGMTSAPQGEGSNGSAQRDATPQLSRKRSRDGTQLPISQPSHGDTPGPVDKKMHNDILLDRYVQRDLYHAASLNDQGMRGASIGTRQEG